MKKIVINGLTRNSNLKTISSLKAELKMEKNSSLILFLMSYLENELQEIDYSTDAAELLEMLRIINCLKIESENDYELIEEHFKRIKEIIDYKKKRIVNYSELSQSLEELEEQINSFLIGLRFEKINQVVKVNDKYINIDNKKIRKLVHDFIFKYRDIRRLNLLLSIYPCISNVKSNNESIVIEILNSYFADPEEREFLSKVIVLFVSNTDFCLSQGDKKTLLDLVDKFSWELNSKDLIFVKEVVTFLGLKQELSFEEDLTSLKIRYGLEDCKSGKVLLKYVGNPTDMTDRKVITIDCNGVLIRDDAISITKKADGTTELGIYITDLSPIKMGSRMDEYAYNHFATIYLKDKWIPMFPEPLVYKFSLDAGVRRVMAFTFTFTPDLKLDNCTVEPAIINVSQCLSYNDVEEILTNGGELYQHLKSMADLSESIEDSLGTISKYHHLKNIVRELGTSMSEIPEKYIDSYGSRIIATTAIFLNNYVANIFDKTRLPFIYRVNGLENQTIINELMKKNRHDRDITEILKSLQTVYGPSSFSTVNTGHKGLGLSAYTQATNPARSYPSLMAQRMIYDIFVSSMTNDQYIEKYQDLESYVKAFNAMQDRNYAITGEYNKLFRKIR